MIEYLVNIQERNQFFHATIHRPVDGALELPQGPGLGIDLDPSTVRIDASCRSATERRRGTWSSEGSAGSAT